MRDVRRINRILKLIKKIWVKNPDSRLGQLIVNVCQYKSKVDIYYIEDEDLEQKLNKIYKVIK